MLRLYLSYHLKMKISVHKSATYLTLLGLLLTYCTEPLDLGQSSGGQQLVVEGWVNDVDSIHVVQLSTSSFDGIGDNILGTNAQVFITSMDENREYPLTEVFPGRYETISHVLPGEVAQSYQLNILLANGQSYQSDIVTIPEPVQITNTEVALLEERGEMDNGTPFTQYSHEVYLDLENTEEDHFVRIVSQGWAELKVDYGLCDEVLGGFGIPGELSCWQFREFIESDINISTNIGITNDEYRVLGVEVPFDFRARYVTELFVNSMSREAFAYWAAAGIQLQRNGGIFDPPFSPVVGNISNLNNVSQPALGYFHAYSQSMIRTCFERTGIPGQLNIPILDCLTTCEDFWAPAVFTLPFDDEICSDGA